MEKNLFLCLKQAKICRLRYKMYLSAAKDILYKEYQSNLSKISTDYQKEFMEEKIRHSYQVLGCGNLLLCSEKCFQRLSLSEKDFLQAVVLLHDVGRFYEIVEKYAGRTVDHGVYGAQYLARIEEFNKSECFLPIRHHGHLISKLYEDEDYLDLPERWKERVRNAAFLVRDADKLANFYLLSRHFREVEDVFFAAYCFEQPNSKVITPVVWDNFVSHCSVRRDDVRNFADMALFFLAWIYDLNFKSSFRFLQKMKIVEKLVLAFTKFWRVDDAEDIYREILGFIGEKCLKSEG